MNSVSLLDSVNKLTNLSVSKLDALSRLGIKRIADLILYKPITFKKRMVFPDIKSLKHGDDVILSLKIKEIIYPSKNSLPTKIFAVNETGGITLTFFKFAQYQKKIYHVGANILISGKVEFFDYFAQIAHPEQIFDKSIISEYEPKYPLTYGITNSQIRSYIYKAIALIGNNEWFDKDILNKLELKTFKDAILRIHSFGGGDITTEDALKRLKYDEALSNQVSFHMIRKNCSITKSRRFEKDKELSELILSKLSFNLTEDQIKVLKEIEKDQNSNMQMLRMVQGDVGCGKTIVSVLAGINVIKSGGQVVLMAPTEVLANQHFATISKWLENTNIACSLLTSKIKTKQKKEILSNIENGEISLIVGTHSLIQEQVKFKDLAFVIVDEQHKFGVNQRIELVSKGSHPDVLLMSATPIPRSLSLAIFGDLDISKIASKPNNRKEIKTLVSSTSRIFDVINLVKKTIELKQKIYWICPLIEKTEDETSDFIDVETRFNFLTNYFDNKVGVLHGKLSQEGKENILNQFKYGEVEILVSTTVVEVGVDVPDATLIIVENAEKFGLAQLHQLRGRVGRSDLQSTCLLLYGKRTSKIAFERLKIMKQSNDGFYIAEKDLVLRGEGEIFGSKQSGDQNFKFLDLATDISIIEECCSYIKNYGLDQNKIFLAKIFNNINSPEKIIL